MRLVDADKIVELLEWLSETINEIGDDEGPFDYWTSTGIDRAIEIIKDAETIDAVQVVRCKDCKYFDWSPDEYGGKIFYCRHDSGLCDWIKEDYYCCFGERKEDSND